MSVILRTASAAAAGILALASGSFARAADQTPASAAAEQMVSHLQAAVAAETAQRAMDLHIRAMRTLSQSEQTKALAGNSPNGNASGRRPASRPNVPTSVKGTTPNL